MIIVSWHNLWISLWKALNELARKTDGILRFLLKFLRCLLLRNADIAFEAELACDLNAFISRDVSSIYKSRYTLYFFLLRPSVHDNGFLFVCFIQIMQMLKSLFSFHRFLSIVSTNVIPLECGFESVLDITINYKCVFIECWNGNLFLGSEN